MTYDSKLPRFPILDEMFMRAVLRNAVRVSLAASVSAAVACSDHGSDLQTEGNAGTGVTAGQTAAGQNAAGTGGGAKDAAVGVDGAIGTTLTDATVAADAGVSPWLDGGMPLDCDDQGWKGLGALALSKNAVAVAFRRELRSGDAGTYREDLAPQWGDPCASAADKLTCETAWESAGVGLPSNTSCSQLGSCTQYVVVAQPDGTSTVADTREELLALLGPIDREAEAVLLALWDNWSVSCSGSETPVVRAANGGYQVIASHNVSDCPITSEQVRLMVSADGVVAVVERGPLVESQACIGRRPEGLVSGATQQQDSDLGAFLARCAHLEAASVDAFAILADELRAHGAPPELVVLAERCAADEVRHAHRVGELAQAYGAQLSAVEVVRTSTRRLEAIALENAVEGCVRETFGAAVGCYQGERAERADIGEVMREVADDEARHASFSWQLAAWLDTRLTPKARARVAAAGAAAVEQLRSSLQVGRTLAMQQDAGWPQPAAARAMFEQLSEDLWSPAWGPSEVPA